MKYRVTKKQTYKWPRKYEVKVNGKKVGQAYKNEETSGWWAADTALGIPLYNSWGHGIVYDSVDEALQAAMKYVKEQLKKQEKTKA